MALIDGLKRPYAKKKMKGQVVPREKLDYILEVVRLAPSPLGLQPFRIFVISNKELLEQIRPIAMNQSPITDCSYILVWAAWDGYSSERIGEVLSKNFRERGLPDKQAEEYKKVLWGAIEQSVQEWHQHHNAKQAYLSFGMAIAAAAEQKVDATPIEGFDPAKLDELLGLDKMGLKSVVLLMLGYRDEANDWLVNLKKARTPKEELIMEIK